MNHLIDLLDLMNRLDDTVTALKAAGHEPGNLMAAGLAGRARRQVKKAAAYLARRQWNAGIDHEIEAERFELAERPFEYDPADYFVDLPF